ncbi:alpha/beta-hydrolase [Basidiobolus meristosporus CBS 931.73]|uniref:Alpha/beta-hydrolase n=1 Tax=Basidiobolus meristosporus CBS 931.73 TaxID=1314790 RepID=A0A1Y1YWC2_9FUNG|nr:alpha/beta-hydrolase [Basidiobolus meristosporus CBS 931.73]|eukprot:ORY02340.1 alpha/beta-hydrolase [Basidiobolus meristosporus CBS 931.73]
MEYQLTTSLLTNPATGIKVSVQHWVHEKAVGSVLFAHATGFHKEIWNPTIEYLKKAAVKYNFLTFDVRNHGDSGLENKDLLSEECDWTLLSQDLLNLLDQVEVKKPLFGVGHSMGGCTTLLAEVARPDTFSGIIALEPIIGVDQKSKAGLMLIEAARRRKSVWEDRDAVKEYLMSKTFFNTWDARVIEEYVNHGMYQTPDGKITLKCPPKQEAATFAGSPNASAYCYEQLHTIQIPVLFVGGKNSNTIFPEMIANFARKTNRGVGRIVPGQHLIPQEHPENTARLITSFLDEQSKGQIRSNL